MPSIVNFLTNPSAANFVQDSTCQVLSEGCLKAIGRPTFTMMDKAATKEQKTYSATKEFLYQSLSMLAYFGMIFPIKANSYKIIKHFPQIKNFNNISDEAKQKLFAAADKAEFNKELKKIEKISPDFITKIKGSQELVSIIASGLILAVITPQIVNKIVHPIMDKIDDKTKNKLDTNA